MPRRPTVDFNRAARWSNTPSAPRASRWPWSAPPGLWPRDRIFGCLQRREAPHHAGLRRPHHGCAERQPADHRDADQDHDRHSRRDQPPARALVLRSTQQPRCDAGIPAARRRNLAPDPRRGCRFRALSQHGALDPRRDAGPVAARSENPGGGGRAGRIRGAVGRALGFAQDRGHRHRFHPAAVASRPGQRHQARRHAGSQGDDPAADARGRDLRRHVFGRQCGGGDPGRAQSGSGCERGHHHLRLGAALPEYGRLCAPA